MEEVSVGVEDIRVGLQGHLVENWFIGGMWTQNKQIRFLPPDNGGKNPSIVGIGSELMSNSIQPFPVFLFPDCVSQG